jgi:hypothetical protein
LAAKRHYTYLGDWLEKDNPRSLVDIAGCPAEERWLAIPFAHQFFADHLATWKQEQAAEASKQRALQAMMAKPEFKILYAVANYLEEQRFVINRDERDYYPQSLDIRNIIVFQPGDNLHACTYAPHIILYSTMRWEVCRPSQGTCRKVADGCLDPIHPGFTDQLDALVSEHLTSPKWWSPRRNP